MGDNVASIENEVISKAQIKKVVQSIIVGQGNEFIKELLRNNNIKIGATKADFLKNMLQAVDDGQLTMPIIESWLEEIEGWGNQHIYLYDPLIFTVGQIRRKIEQSKFASLINHTTTQEFPSALALTSISFTDSAVSFSWHVGNTDWIRVSSKDYEKTEAGDLYQYRAFRHVSDRAVVRYEWEQGQPYSAFFVQLPNSGNMHEDVIEVVWGVLRETGLITSLPNRVVLNNSVNKISNTPAEATATSKTMRADGGYVEMVSTLTNGGIDQVAPIRDVNRAVNASDFSSAEGRFKLSNEVHTSLSRPVKLEMFGLESRIRVWVKCTRKDIYTVLAYIWINNQTS